MSRHPAFDLGEILSVTMGTPEWLQEIQAGYKNDVVTQKMLLRLQNLDSTHQHLVWDNGILRYKRKIWVGSNTIIQQKIL